MFDILKSGFKRGLKQTRENPQLAYTLLTAVAIFFGFLFTSNNFLLIAKDAQDRLVNIRVGSMQDVLREFIPQYVDKPEELSDKIRGIARHNETIREFRVIIFDQGEKKIISSLDETEIDKIDEKNDFLYNLAIVEKDHSLTTEDIVNGERVFKTVRAIIDIDGSVIGVIYTSQSLSMADRMISRGIANGIFILILVLIMIMILFFRHAKIIDYAVLYRRLEEINKIKDDFISIATHELRTPLTIIRGYIDILGSSKKMNSRDKRLVEIADIHSKKLSILIDDILSVPKIEQGKMDFRLETFNPENEIKETVDSLKQNAEEKGLKISHHIESSALITADRNKLRQILTNILGNAVKYTEKGEVKVNVSINGNQIIIRVSDTGIGMSAEEQRGLFQKFYRVRSKETENITGTGLGLWITSKFVKAMNGSISVESIKGIGTHFVISFPIAKTEEKN